MTRDDLIYAWAQIASAAEAHGVSPAEVREDIKASIAKLWEDEERGSNEWPARVQVLHRHFSAPPSVEALLTRRRELVERLDMDYNCEPDFF